MYLGPKQRVTGERTQAGSSRMGKTGGFKWEGKIQNARGQRGPNKRLIVPPELF